MTKIYVKFVDGIFHPCDIIDADFSAYSINDSEKILNNLNNPFYDIKDDIFLGFFMGNNKKGYKYFKTCKRSQKLRYLINEIKKVV